MISTAKLRLLARELELKTHFGEMVAQDLEEVSTDPTALDEQMAMATAVVSTASKVSRLLWRYGQRITDTTDRDEATELRSRLGLDDESLLAPAQIAPLTEVLRMPTLRLAEAWEPESMTLSLEGSRYELRPLGEQMGRIRHALAESHMESLLTVP